MSCLLHQAYFTEPPPCVTSLPTLKCVEEIPCEPTGSTAKTQRKTVALIPIAFLFVVDRFLRRHHIFGAFGCCLSVAMSNLNVRGFATVAGADKLDGSSGTSEASPNVGGRIDYRQKIDRFNFVVSGTDASARNYEDAPKIKDAVITADTHQDGAPPFLRPSCAHQRPRRLLPLTTKLFYIPRHSAANVRICCSTSGSVCNFIDSF